MDAIRFNEVRLSARGRSLLDGFSLVVAPGDHCTLTGPSGGGKSTLLRCLMGFSEPDTGDVFCLGQRVGPQSAWAIRRQVGWVAQEPAFGGGIVQDALEAPFRFKANRHLEKNLQRVPGLMKRLRLDPALLAQPVTRLSGGEKQRIAVLAVLLLDRPLLLLDEASSALDPESRGVLAELLRSMDETTILSVAHDPASFDLGGAVVDLRGVGGQHGAH